MTSKLEEHVYENVLELAKEVGKDKGHGALFVIADKGNFKRKYELLYPQLFDKKNISEKGMIEVLYKLATLDGAILFSRKGDILAYGARIKRSKTLPGYGTRHAAAAGITIDIPTSTAILVSSGAGWIRIFQKGKIVLELDATTKTTRTVTHKIITFITDHDTTLIAAAGASAAIIGFGPVLVISGTYLVVKGATGIIKKNLKNLNFRKNHD